MHEWILFPQLDQSLRLAGAVAATATRAASAGLGLAKQAKAAPHASGAYDGENDEVFHGFLQTTSLPIWYTSKDKTYAMPVRPPSWSKA